MKDKIQTEELELSVFASGEKKPGLFLLPESSGPGDLDFIINKIKTLKVNQKMAEKFALAINLTYLEEEGGEGNVCMANSDEVLPEFREICTANDLRKYVISRLRSAEISEQTKDSSAAEIKIPIPQDATVFWKAVEVSER